MPGAPIKTASPSSASVSLRPSIAIHRLKNLTQHAPPNKLLSFIPKTQTLLKSYLAVEPINIFTYKPNERLERKEFWHTEVSVEGFEERGGDYIGEDMGIPFRRRWSPHSQVRSALAGASRPHRMSNF